MLGLGDWEFCNDRECDREKLFSAEASPDARQWLQQSKFDLDKMLDMRALLSQENSTWGSPMMSDDEVIVLVGYSLGSGGLHVHGHLTPVLPPRGATSGVPAPTAPFPLSERKPAAQQPSSNMPPIDPATFPSDLNAAAQALALAGAALLGQAFCQQCQNNNQSS